MNTNNIKDFKIKFLVLALVLIGIIFFAKKASAVLYMCQPKNGPMFLQEQPCGDAKELHRYGDPKPDPKPVPQQKQYTGDRLTVNYESIDMEAFVNVLESFTGIPFVLRSQVTGNFPLRVKNIPWDELLDSVLNETGLVAKYVNGTIYIGWPRDF
ncbi:secretin and TonB N-terminal domain-containing protein [Allochromatium palmeri]|uniref:Secretin/TonB short N-terminal domain-containing protein n=1 Tax=Allochromatium palmeri TaxID=231048 RepID=A0A6N8EFY5_9GAMM|nr:STN domain-containing protein [Allochromatium palmeri]MTW23232.1 hypothetical protein [Allochromatium palmeri]